MGASVPIEILGSGGGGKRKDSGGGESPDTLSSVALARFVDLIGEGEIGGLVNGERSIYLDGVPLRSTEGTPNYKPFRWDYRSGTPSQTPIPGFAGTQSQTDVGLKIQKSMGRIVRSVPDAGAEAIRVTVSVAGLSTTTTDGKINGASVTFRIWARTISGAWVKVHDGLIDGKTMSKFQRSIEVPTSGLGVGPYEVGVERVTNDSTSSLVVNDLYWDSFTILNYEQFSYPNSALLALELDARYFNAIPARSYHVRGLLIKVPTNYYRDGVPVAYTTTTLNPRYATSGPGTTNGAWDGTFKIVYSNNPAWCYYDLLLSRRYGLGRRISPALVNKWEVYAIGQYCDQLVSTGLNTNLSDILGSSAMTTSGGLTAGVPVRTNNLEPRFTLNCVINTADEAYKVLSQLTSVFRGMAYWGSGQAILTQDRFTKPSIIYTNANVVDGKFTYQGSARSARHTTCAVGWNDPAEDFRQKFEYVEDRDGIARYGVVPTDIVAFGCTSRSQARRVGLALLYTERLESDMVTFKVGMDSAFLRPGSTALLMDADRAGLRWGGRVISATTTTLTLDAPVTLTAGTYTLSVMAQDGTVTTRTFTTAAGTFSAVAPSAAFAVAPAEMAVWTLASTAVTPMQVRIVSIAQDGTVTAIENNPTKYAAIDSGVPTTQQNYSVLSATSVPPLTGLQGRENSFKTVGSFDVQSHIEVSWDRLQDPMVRGYIVQCRGDVQKELSIPETTDCAVTFRGVVPDTYTVTVQAVNTLGIKGPASVVAVVVTGVDSIGPAAVTGFSAATGLGGVALTWNACTDSDYAETEIRVGPTFDTATVRFVGSASAWLWPWPAEGTYVVWAVHRDSSGNLGAPVSAAAVVGATGGLISWESISGIPIDAIYNSRVGQSGNLLANTTFGAKTITPWTYQAAYPINYWGTESQRDNAQPYAPLGMDALVLRQLGIVAGGDTAIHSDIHSEFIPVVPGQRVEASISAASHRCDVQLHIQWYTEAKVGIGSAMSVPALRAEGGQQLSQFNRLVVFATMPPTAAYCNLIYRKLNTLAGQADSYCWLLAPYFGIAGADQTVPTPYSPSTSVSLAQAAAAKTAADNAATSAALALARVENEANDNILNRGGKGQAIQDWNVLDSEFAQIDAQAASFGITTQRTAHANAKSALGVYLSGLSPLWSDVTTDTVIVGTTYRSMWSNAILTQSALRTEISRLASLRAEWGNTSGRPANVAGLVGTEELLNEKLGQASNLINCQTGMSGNSTAGWVLGSWVAGMPPLYQGAERARDPSGTWSPVGANPICLYQGAPATTANQWAWGGQYPGGNATFAVAYTEALIPVEPLTRVCGSAWVAHHRCEVDLYVEFLKADGSAAGSGIDSSPGEVGGGNSLGGWRRLKVFAVAPSDAVAMRLVFAKRNTATGQANSYAWMCMPMIERAGPLQTVPSDYSPAAPSDTRQLGYTGELDATNGAIIGTNLGGQINSTNRDSLIASNTLHESAAMTVAQNLSALALADFNTPTVAANSDGGCVVLFTGSVTVTSSWQPGSAYPANYRCALYVGGNKVHDSPILSAAVLTTGNSSGSNTELHGVAFSRRIGGIGLISCYVKIYGEGAGVILHGGSTLSILSLKGA